MNKHLILLALASMVAGCASDPAAIRAVAEANAKIAKTATIEMTCPEQGCVFSNFKYTDPNNRQFVKMPTNGWDAVTSLGNSAERVVTGALPFAAVGYVAKKGFEAAGHNVSNVASGDGSSTGGAGSFSQVGPDSANQANVTTNANQANTTSADSHAVDSHAVDSHSVDNHSQTAPPTVVVVP